MSHDTWIHRTVRGAVRPLARTPVTPNQVTTLRLITGLAAAAAFAQGGEGWRQAGAGLFLVSLFLDRADGELARASGKSSRWGHAYDLWSDAACDSLAFLGLGVGLAGGAFGPWAPAMGAVAGLAIAACFLLTVRLEARHGARAGELSGAAGFDPDDALLVVPVAVWLGLSEWLLGAACLGAPLFLLYYLARFRGRLRGPAPLGEEGRSQG